MMQSKSCFFILLLNLMTFMVVTARDDSLVRQSNIELCKALGRETYENPNPNENSENVEMCCKCLPGSYKASDCKPHVPETTVCKDCPFNKTDSTNQYYMDVHNNSTTCHRSLQPSECESRMRTKYVMGSRYNNSRCDCIPGSYKDGDGCLKHSTCDPGFQPSSLGTTTSNTKCEPCSPGSFSNISSTTALCISHSLCPVGKVKVKDGTSTSDTLCLGSNSNLSVTAVTTLMSVTAPIVTMRNQISSSTTIAPSLKTHSGAIIGGTLGGIGVVVGVVVGGIIILYVWWKFCRNTDKPGVWWKFCRNTDKPDESPQDTTNPEYEETALNSSPSAQIVPQNSQRNGNVTKPEEVPLLEKTSKNRIEGDLQVRIEQDNIGNSNRRNEETTNPHLTNDNTEEMAPPQLHSSETEEVRWLMSENQPENDTRIAQSNTDEPEIQPYEAQAMSLLKYDMEEKQDIDYIDGSQEINSKAIPIDPSSPRERSSKSTHSADLIEQEDSEATGDNQARSSEQSSENPGGTETTPKDTCTSTIVQTVAEVEPETSDLETPLQYAKDRARNIGATDLDIEDALANSETGKEMMDTLINDFEIAIVKKYVRTFLTDVEIDDIENDEQLSYERRYKWIKLIQQKLGLKLTPKSILDEGFELNAIRDSMVKVFVKSLNCRNSV